MTITVHRFTPGPFCRWGRIALDVDASVARRQYRRLRKGDHLVEPRSADAARCDIIHVFCKAVDE